MDFLRPSSPAPVRLTVLVGCFVASICALLATVGADADWLAALGRDIAQSWSIPNGVPFAAAASEGWHNVPVLGELVFHWLQASLGSRGLVIAQVAAVVACLWLVSTDMRRAGVADAPAALVLMLTAFAAAPALLVVRSQLFSLALFPLLVLLLREEARRPSRRVWLLVPLVALWSNLHGGVLLGVAVAGAYLLFARLRRDPLVAGGVLAGMALALFATPALAKTADYYRGVIGSQAASRGEGLWQPLSLPLAVRSGLPRRGDPARSCSRCARTRVVGVRRDRRPRICGSTGEPERGLAGALHRASGREGAGGLAVVAADGAEERRDRGDRPARPRRDHRAGADAASAGATPRAPADGRARARTGQRSSPTASTPSSSPSPATGS